MGRCSATSMGVMSRCTQHLPWLCTRVVSPTALHPAVPLPWFCPRQVHEQSLPVAFAHRASHCRVPALNSSDTFSVRSGHRSHRSPSARSRCALERVILNILFSPSHVALRRPSQARVPLVGGTVSEAHFPSPSGISSENLDRRVVTTPEANHRRPYRCHDRGVGD